MEKQDFLETNRKYWNERVAIHLKSGFYDVDSFRRGRNMLNDLEKKELGDISGKTLLHLQCHFGIDSLSLEMLGANVTGVDYSEEAIRAAEQLRDEMKMRTKFILADVLNLREIPGSKFDIVYTSYGVLTWLPDIDEWGRTVSRFLKDDGFFYIAEIHPASLMFEGADGKDNLEVKYPYFRQDKPLHFNDPGSYAVKDAVTGNNTTYEWTHSMSDIVMSLIKAGLKIEFFHEHDFTVWEHFRGMKKGDDGYYRLEKSLPLLFSMKAVKDLS